MIMFGGFTNVARDCLQSGAQCNGAVNNEIYEFVFEKGREKGKLHEFEIIEIMMTRILVGCRVKWKKTTTTSECCHGND